MVNDFVKGIAQGRNVQSNMRSTNVDKSFSFSAVTIASGELELQDMPLVIEQADVSGGNFILGHTNFGILGTSTLGGTLTYSTTEIINPNDTWRTMLTTKEMDFWLDDSSVSPVGHWILNDDAATTAIVDSSANSNDGVAQQNTEDITNTSIADFEDELDGFSTGCGGSPSSSYDTGYNGSNKSLKLWPTASDWLACASKDMGDVKAGDEFYLWAKGDKIWIQIYNGDENGNNSTLQRYDSTAKTWSVVSGYHEQTTWALYKLVVNRNVSGTDYPALNKMYLYTHGEGNEGWFDEIRKRSISISDDLSEVISFNGVAGCDGVYGTFRHYPLTDDAANTTIDETGYQDDDAAADRNTNLMSSLVGWWKLEEDAANTTVVDSSGKSSTGTASVNTSLLSTDGKINDGFEFLQTENVNFGDIAGIDGSSKLTVCGWFYVPDDSSSSAIHIFNKGKYHDATSAFGISYTTDNNRFNMSIQETYKWRETSIVKGAWNFYALVYDGTNDYFRYYVNGVGHDRDGASEALPATIAATGDDVLINANRDGQSARGDLKTDEQMIFLRSLSDDELDEIYNSGNGRVENIVEQTPIGSKALYFNGSSDQLTLGNISTPTDYFSMAAWVKVDELGNNMILITKGTANGKNTVDIRTGIDTTGHLVLAFDSGGLVTVTSTGTISAGEWTHVAITMDTFLGSGNVKFYIGGDLDSSAAQATTLPNNTSVWSIGDLPDNSYPYKGYIGDMRTGLYPFGANEIKEAYNEGAGTYLTQDYLKMTSDVTLDLTGASIAFWMKTSNTYWTNLFAKDINATLGFLAFQRSDNTFNYETDTNNFGGTSDALTTDINDGEWHHFVHTFEEDGANTKWKIYVDNVLEATTSHTKSTNQELTLRYIGLQGSQGRYVYGEGFKGELNDLRLYNFLVDEADRNYIYNSGTGEETTEGTATLDMASQDITFAEGEKFTTNKLTTPKESNAPITKATLSLGNVGNPSKLIYYLSADDGTNYEAVTLGSEHTFTNTGTTLKMKAIASGGTASIDILDTYGNPTPIQIKYS